MLRLATLLVGSSAFELQIVALPTSHIASIVYYCCVAENYRGDKTLLLASWLLLSSPRYKLTFFPSNLLFSAHANLNTGVKNDRYSLVTRVIEYQRMNKPSMVEL